MKRKWMEKNTLFTGNRERNDNTNSDREELGKLSGIYNNKRVTLSDNHVSVWLPELLLINHSGMKVDDGNLCIY